MNPNCIHTHSITRYTLGIPGEVPEVMAELQKDVGLYGTCPVITTLLIMRDS